VHEGPLVVVSGGGTGGHLYPALALADALRERRPDVRILFIGARRGIEARVLPERGERHLLLPAYGIDRSRPLQSWRALTGLLASVFRVARVFARDRPEMVVVTGGYAAAAAGIVAGLSGVPLVLQEQNSVPGAVTRLLSRWAARVHVAFPEAQQRLSVGRDRVRVSGNPVRPAAVRGREEARAAYGVPKDAVLLLVAGGSQGAVPLNRLLGDALGDVAAGTLDRPERLHVLWSTGPRNFDDAVRVLAECGSPAWVHAVPYIDDMPSALAAADLSVGRAGAMSTAELLNQGLPAVLVPLPSAAADHQTENARSLERAGAAVTAPQSELDGGRLWGEILGLLGDPERLASMRSAALRLARPSAAAEIAADVELLLSRPGANR
jgi:UDP-N-acetylglucosamine--N-acetylmuramyl-(pentapeptide) pyrophosphoryl-undecaprenol N-acetylglucosamine transferase